MAPSTAVIVLTDGSRAEHLDAMARSVADQPIDERILVVNGPHVATLPGWTIVESETNLGVPGGRTLGAQTAAADVLIFLDDDSAVRSPDLAAIVADMFDAQSDLGAVAFRIVVTNTDESLDRWIPAHGAPGPSGLADAATFPGGGHALRASAFDQVGGYTADFFFKHEETELAWKLLDAGWNVAYSSDLVVEHPRTSESRNPVALYNGVRNKIWLARLLLPRPLSWWTSVLSTLATLSQTRSGNEVRTVVAAVRAASTSLPGHRRPIRWSTVRALGNRGRWPIR